MGVLKLLVFVVLLLGSVRSALKVVGPNERLNIFPNNEIKAVYAPNITMPFGTKMMGRVYALPQSADGCAKIPNFQLPAPDDLYVPMVLVAKGNCSLKSKSINTKAMGGFATLTPMLASEVDIEDKAEGSTVPTLLLTQADWDTLKKWADESESDSNKTTTPKPRVVLQADFEMVKGSVVENEIWLLGVSKKVQDFLNEMKPFYDRLGALVTFTPHTLIFSCSWCSAQEKAANCLEDDGVTYCAVAGSDTNLTGKEIVEQSVTQTCSYKVQKEANNIPPWFVFMKSIGNCSKDRINSSCWHEAKVKAPLNEAATDACVAKPGPLLSEDLKWIKNYGILTTPVITINRKVYAGSWEAKKVFEAICAEFNTTPSACGTSPTPPPPPPPPPPPTPNNEGRGHRVIVIIIVLLALGALLAYCYKRVSSRSEAPEQAQPPSTPMAEYYNMQPINRDT